jgi:hypothetical protein
MGAGAIPLRRGQVRFTEWTHAGAHRHPSFQRFEDHGSPRDPAALLGTSKQARLAPPEPAGSALVDPVRSTRHGAQRSRFTHIGARAARQAFLLRVAGVGRGLASFRERGVLDGRQSIGCWLTVVALVGGGCREAPGAPPAAPPPSRPAVAALPSASLESVQMPAQAPIELALIDDFNPPRRPAAGGDGQAPGAAWDAALGGLSGLFYSAPEGLLYAISDDRGRFPARLYTFAVELGERSLRVEPRSVVLLHEPTPTSSLIEMDGEGIAGVDQSLLVSLEGNAEPAHQRESRILRFQRDGLLTGQLSVPAAFRPAPPGEPPRGTRPNLGIEGLCVSPGGRFLFASSEEALYQDGELTTFEGGTFVRIARWDLERGGDPSEHLYRTDPVAPRLDGATMLGNGVSEIVALDDSRLLVLERAFVKNAARAVNNVRIYEADLARSGSSAPAPSALPVVSRRLVLDLADIVGGFDEGLRELDNFEGMALGPRLPSGNPSLLLVSDDNFSASQRTVFLAFELRAGTPGAPRSLAAP